MESDDEVQDYLHLSGEFLRSAQRDVAEGLLAPARMSMLQALELALKAAIMAKTRTTGDRWTSHNVHGPFGHHFRDHLGGGVLSRINRLIQECGKSRYPDWPTPSVEEMRNDLALVTEVVEEITPRLIREESA